MSVDNCIKPSTNGFFRETWSFTHEAEGKKWFCLPCWDKRFRPGIWPWTPYPLGAGSFPLRKDRPLDSEVLESGMPSREL